MSMQIQPFLIRISSGTKFCLKTAPTIQESQEIYSESSELWFKLRFDKRNQSFKNQHYISNTGWPKYIWKLNEIHVAFNLE